jgi:hypothetical protein
MHLKSWYKVLVLIWLITGLPVLILGYGFSGRQFSLPDPEFMGVVDIAFWVIGWSFVLSPLIAAPFGLKRRHNAN